MDNRGPGYREHPEHRVVVEPFAGWVTVDAGGKRIADSRRALAVRESGYPVVYYLPRPDVDMAALQPRSEHTSCPFKGEASYFGLAHEDVSIAFSYEEPYDEVRALAGHIAFYPQRVDKLIALPDINERAP